MKHKPVQASKLQNNKTCPRCGDGTFLAKHKDRLYCGKCRYTEFLQSNKS